MTMPTKQLMLNKRTLCRLRLCVHKAVLCKATRTQSPMQGYADHGGPTRPTRHHGRSVQGYADHGGSMQGYADHGGPNVADAGTPCIWQRREVPGSRACAAPAHLFAHPSMQTCLPTTSLHTCLRAICLQTLPTCKPLPKCHYPSSNELCCRDGIIVTARNPTCACWAINILSNLTSKLAMMFAMLLLLHICQKAFLL